jgi:hypothetical protein
MRQLASEVLGQPAGPHNAPAPGSENLPHAVEGAVKPSSATVWPPGTLVLGTGTPFIMRPLDSEVNDAGIEMVMPQCLGTDGPTAPLRSRLGKRLGARMGLRSRARQRAVAGD